MYARKKHLCRRPDGPKRAGSGGHPAAQGGVSRRRLHAGLRPRLAAAGERPAGGPVYRRPGEYPSVAALAEAEPEDIEAIVKPCGLGRSKARDISACMRMLRDKYDCKVPTTFEELLALPGVGRKSANLIMGDVFGKPAIVTDTHCIRLCNKIGLVDGIKEPQKVEMALWKIVPPEEGSDLCHRFVMHGRAVCNARKPECEKCCLSDICRYAREEASNV